MLKNVMQARFLEKKIREEEEMKQLVK